jgi:hypothetical protein
MIWIAVCGVLVALLLMLVAVIAVIAAALPVMRHAKALVPDALRAKFVRARDSIARLAALG